MGSKIPGTCYSGKKKAPARNAPGLVQMVFYPNRWISRVLIYTPLINGWDAFVTLTLRISDLGLLLVANSVRQCLVVAILACRLLLFHKNT